MIALVVLFVAFAAKSADCQVALCSPTSFFYGCQSYSYGPNGYPYNYGYGSSYNYGPSIFTVGAGSTNYYSSGPGSTNYYSSGPGSTNYYNNGYGYGSPGYNCPYPYTGYPYQSGCYVQPGYIASPSTYQTGYTSTSVVSSSGSIYYPYPNYNYNNCPPSGCILATSYIGSA